VPQTVVFPPDRSTLVAYSTVAAFDALAVGRWRRTAGEADVRCESFGIEFTADHRIVPLAYASDGTVQPVLDLGAPFTLGIDGATGGISLLVGSFTTGAPVFSDGGMTMQLTYYRASANYVRVSAAQ
jgi:hypothetical protein